jgi:hypothetical protein
MAKSAQQPVKAIPTRACFVAEMQPLATTPQPRHKLHYGIGPVLQNAVMSHLSASSIVGNRHRSRRFVHIKST